MLAWQGFFSELICFVFLVRNGGNRQTESIVKLDQNYSIIWRATSIVFCYWLQVVLGCWFFSFQISPKEREKEPQPNPILLFNKNSHDRTKKLGKKGGSWGW